MLDRIHIALGTDSLSRADLVRVAHSAEDLGFRGLWLTEALGRDAFSVLTEIALSTRRLELGTGIVNVFGRSPATLAQAAVSLSEAAGGRPVHLGIGTSGRAVIEGFHGVPFHRPVARLRDYVRILKSTLANGVVGFDGDVVRTHTFRLAARPAGPVDVFVAGLTPASQSVAAEAGGWLPIWFDEQEIPDSPAATGRIAAYYYTSVNAGDPATAQDEVRRSAAWYLAANGTAYANLFRRRGYGEEVDRVIDHWRRGDRAGARAAVPDEIVTTSGLAGTPDAVLARLATVLAAGVTDPVLRFPDGAPADRIAEMLTLLSTVD
ncbi:LLM class flavin-dependent oxidoreductase [Saccharomonospora sp. NPDC046836]|uniref:LLM class flavin-dependent oxidoreductase n=1 Tax=Saccharomonospora sp. NPDC046836 TaxID=3156921 RepID=UPI0033F77F85